MASKDFTRLQIHYWIQIHNRCSTANGRSLQNLCTATFFESQPSARWTKGLRKATTGSLKKSNNQPINRYFVDCGHIVCPPNIWDSPLHPPILPPLALKHHFDCNCATSQQIAMWTMLVSTTWGVFQLNNWASQIFQWHVETWQLCSFTLLSIAQYQQISQFSHSSNSSATKGVTYELKVLLKRW